MVKLGKMGLHESSSNANIMLIYGNVKITADKTLGREYLLNAEIKYPVIEKSLSELNLVDTPCNFVVVKSASQVIHTDKYIFDLDISYKEIVQHPDTILYIPWEPIINTFGQPFLLLYSPVSWIPSSCVLLFPAIKKSPFTLITWWLPNFFFW